MYLRVSSLLYVVLLLKSAAGKETMFRDKPLSQSGKTNSNVYKYVQSLMMLLALEISYVRHKKLIRLLLPLLSRLWLEAHTAACKCPAPLHTAPRDAGRTHEIQAVEYYYMQTCVCHANAVEALAHLFSMTRYLPARVVGQRPIAAGFTAHMSYQTNRL